VCGGSLQCAKALNDAARRSLDLGYAIDDSDFLKYFG
jgi:hypothetical protein